MALVVVVDARLYAASAAFWFPTNQAAQAAASLVVRAASSSTKPSVSAFLRIEGRPLKVGFLTRPHESPTTRASRAQPPPPGSSPDSTSVAPDLDALFR